MALSVNRFPLCCGIAVITGFGNDPRHPHRDRRGDGPPTLQQIEDYLRNAERDARTGGGLMNAIDGTPVGMLLAAVNIPQREFMYPIFRRLGWRRAGACTNLHDRNNHSEVFLFRKVIEEVRE